MNKDSWTGDSHVKIPISNLHPEDLEMVAVPFPMADVVTMVEVYTNACFDIRLPRCTSNITLRLDAPGLARVNVPSFLPQVHVVVGYDKDYCKGPITKTKVVKAEHEPYVVDMTNTTLTLDLLKKLWPVLVRATTDLLVLGLGHNHNDYRALRDDLRALTYPKKPVLISRRPGPSLVLIALAGAKELWGELYSVAEAWPLTAHEWLHDLTADMEDTESHWRQQKPGKEGDSNPFTPRLGSPRLPSSTQLLRHARRQHTAYRTLPGLLASLPVSRNATVQAYQTKAFFTRIAPHHAGGREPSRLEADINLLCFSRKLLEVVAKARCPDHISEESVLQNPLPYWTPFGGNTGCGSGSCLHSLHDALCDAELFITAFAAKARQVRARVQDAVSQRGGFSLAERAAGSYGRDGIVRRARTFDRALDTLDALLASLAVQHCILAGMAVRMLHVCALQNGLRERARALHENQSA
jgi:hypothetical protein